MQLNLNKLRQHTIQQNPDSEKLPDKVEVPAAIIDTPAVDITNSFPEAGGEASLKRSDPTTSYVAVPAANTAPASEVELESEDDVTDLESALAADAADAADQAANHGAAASGAASSEAKPASWIKASYSGQQELARNRSLPGKAVGKNYVKANGCAVQTHFSYRDSPWDSRVTFFDDFYSDPLKYWSPPLLAYIKEAYLDGMPMVDIIARIAKKRKARDTLPPFTANHLGPPRIIDLYAVLYTCALIPLGRAFPDNPQYAKCGMMSMREAIVDEANPRNSELPLPLFPEAYKRWAAKGPAGKFSDLGRELMRDYPQLHQVQVYYTLYSQLGKAIKRRLVTIRKTQPHNTNPSHTGKAFLKSAQQGGMVFRHGDQLMCLLEWPAESDAPLDILPSQSAYPLSYLLEALPSLQAHLGEPTYDAMQHLRNLLNAYQTEGRPARLTNHGTLDT